jgi:S-formylglutathione hydrolase
MEETSSSRCFGGYQKFFTHASEVLGCDMNFAVYLPPQAERGTCPILYWLSGLTCTEQNFVTKAGAQRAASENGLIVVAPDTSPRGTQVPDIDDPYLGCGAGFYVNATQAPWRDYYLMHDYVVTELPALVEAAFPVTKHKKKGVARGISGHSMGGHGAIVLALRNPGRYRSLSAFAPIASATRSRWGQNAFLHYLGEDRSTWEEWDASLLVRNAPEKLPMMVDQGEQDPFLMEQLKPSLLQKACSMADHPLKMRLHPGYDHSYFFVASFIDEHMKYHAAAMAS